MSFMWVWSSVLVKILVHRVLGYGAHQVEGGAYNPLTVLSAAVSGDFENFLFTLGARIPAQVVGSVYGVRHILHTFPEIGRGPRLTVDITKGALTEGFLTFAIVILSLGLARKISNSFYMKTWISSVSKLALHILGSDLTGGCMNPASVMGWAFANGEHITKEHIIVYWLAPVEATLAAVWVFGLLVQPEKDETSTPKKNEAPPLKSQKSD
ncbi:probable aquaporin sip2-1 [Phtheirospermum japonicum]|uniref:Probable aquaporin sip2-1 n=1 Tax=Phtheirospermum japonicum TaxID=374723 RepID=A0A830D7D9_9LAMI|nr:probable aquaporin sip2-1 [Phtheirospermum japonicum]